MRKHRILWWSTVCLALLMALRPLPEPAALDGQALSFEVVSPPVEALMPVTRAAPPPVSADAAVLMDAESGRLLFAKEAHQRRAPASTTKIMTAVLALELGQPQDLVRVSRRAAWTPGSSAQLGPGERYRLGDLLKGLLLPSGNDAAVAIAEHLAGSVPDFAALMNAKAAELGMRDTRFVNPHGLTQIFHYSSAYDLAVVTRYALRYPAFRSIVSMAEGELTGMAEEDRIITRKLHNTNRLLLSYPWVDGVKTGTTAAAGSCLVASAARDGRRLIAVVLHSGNRWGDAIRLLQWGFDNFEERSFARLGQRVTTIAVKGGLDAYLDLVAADDAEVEVSALEAPHVRAVVDAVPVATAPIRAGQRLGSLVIVVGDEVLVRVPLVAERAVPVWSLRGWFLRWWRAGSAS